MDIKHGTGGNAEHLSDIFIIRFGLLVSNLEKFLADGMPESLHQSRVSARKLEALFDTFGHMSRSGEYKKISALVSGLISLLGAGRETDVCIQFTNSYLEIIKVHDAGIMNFIAFLKSLARINRNSSLLKPNAEALIGEKDSVRKFFMDYYGPQCPFSGREKLTEYLRYEIPKLYDVIMAYKAEVLAGKKRKLHKMRIKSKPLRYMLETYSEFLDSGIEKYHKDFKAFTEQAGLVHDYDVLIEILDKYRKEIVKQSGKNDTLPHGNSLKVFRAYLSRMRKTEFEHLKQILEKFNEDYRKSFANALMQ